MHKVFDFLNLGEGATHVTSSVIVPSWDSDQYKTHHRRQLGWFHGKRLSPAMIISREGLHQCGTDGGETKSMSAVVMLRRHDDVMKFARLCRIHVHRKDNEGFRLLSLSFNLHETFPQSFGLISHVHLVKNAE